MILPIKIIDADKAVDLGLYEEKILKNGKVKRVKATELLKQCIIITFSRKIVEYQRAVRERQIERAKKLLEKKNSEEIKKEPHDIKKFMKMVTHTKSGEKTTVEYLLDEAKLEDCFRIIKTNFTGRPANHRLPNRIKTHFLICYTALLVYRLPGARLDDQETHATPQNLITTLRNMNVTNNAMQADINYSGKYKESLTSSIHIQRAPCLFQIQKNVFSPFRDL